MKSNNNSYQNSQYKLFLTNKAQGKIEKLMLKNVNMIGLKIDIKKSGCAGFSYTFKEEIKHNEIDIILEYEKGIKIFISPETISFIDGSELDYIGDELNHNFTFKNPNIRHLCGCGESFNLF